VRSPIAIEPDPQRGAQLTIIADCDELRRKVQIFAITA
jgi:hypothetical protein